MSCRPGQPASGRQARRASAEPNRGAAEGWSAGCGRECGLRADDAPLNPLSVGSRRRNVRRDINRQASLWLTVAFRSTGFGLIDAMGVNASTA